MAKKEAAQVADTGNVDAGTEAKKNSHRVVLPNGQERATFIRDMYYNGPEELKGNRSAIKNAINKMYEEAGQPEGQIPYQIVFAATKTETDPRIAQAEAREARARAKAEAATKATEAEAGGTDEAVAE